jgi:hypothetical protein
LAVPAATVVTVVTAVLQEVVFPAARQLLAALAVMAVVVPVVTAVALSDTIIIRRMQSCIYMMQLPPEM